MKNTTFKKIMIAGLWLGCSAGYIAACYTGKNSDVYFIGLLIFAATAILYKD